MDHREELEVLIELAHAGNMRRAAESLGISQSTLSEITTRLEASYGAPLFVRDRRGSRPTVYGELVVQAAARALRIMDEAQREIGLIKSSESGRLSVGAELGLIEAYLAPAIARGLERYPKLRYRLQAADSSTLAHELREKRIDFLFGTRPDVSTRGLALRELGTARVVPVCRVGHPLAGDEPRELRDIVRFPIAQGVAQRWFLARVGEELELEGGARTTQRNAAVIANDVGVIRTVVAETDAIGFLPHAAVRADIARGTFARIRLTPHQQDVMTIPMVVATFEDRILPPAALALIEELENVIARESEEG
jgi:DNA-binding transcriptional LysR family regulator